jgi:hypothetical protein
LFDRFNQVRETFRERKFEFISKSWVVESSDARILGKKRFFLFDPLESLSLRINHEGVSG